MTFLTTTEIKAMGFMSVGDNVQISSRASFYNCAQISIGNHVRIDDFCVLSAGNGGILIGNYIHIGIYSSLIGAGRITLSDFSNVSSKVAIYSSNDDYSGAYMTNPTVPQKYTGVTHGDVWIGKHAIIGCGSIVLPSVTIEDGVAIGALSLVKKNCTEFGIYMGNPAVHIKNRKRDLLLLEQNFLTNQADNKDIKI